MCLKGSITRKVYCGQFCHNETFQAHERLRESETNKLLFPAVKLLSSGELPSTSGWLVQQYMNTW